MQHVKPLIWCDIMHVVLSEVPHRVNADNMSVANIFIDDTLFCIPADRLSVVYSCYNNSLNIAW